MSRPNLLFIFTDEQRFDTLACYGNARIAMPNLNRLASRSVVFDRAYVTQPVCTPSRSTILTGLWPHQNGCTENNLPLDVNTPCLPELARCRDYATAYHGKWHLGDEVFAQHGFDEWGSIEDAYRNYYSTGRGRDTKSSYYHWLRAQGIMPDNGDVFTRSEAARLPEHLGKPAFLAQEACRFLRENRNRPFIHFVNFLEPHMPFFGPRDSQYDPQDVLLPGNFDDEPTENQPLKARLNHRGYRETGHSGLPLTNEAEWRRMVANYWGLCSLVDTHVGKILDCLDACDLSDNTIVVFTSDHGDMMSSHRLLAKCVMFEEAIRVPMLIRLPGQKAMRRVGGPVSQIDLVPTLLDLMGEEVPDNLPGESLRPLCEANGDARPRKDVVVEWNGGNNGFGDTVGEVVAPPWMHEMASVDEIAEAVRDPVRTILSPDGWKLNCSQLGEHELYDLTADPGETRNLAFEPAQNDRCRRMRERLLAWQRETNDTIVLPEIA